MKACSVCGVDASIEVERRNGVPVAQNLVLPYWQDAISCPVGELDIYRCTSCGFVWNHAFDPSLLAYGAAYDNNQHCSPRFQDHTEEIAALIETYVRGEAVRLVEVGCGQGTFMTMLARRFAGRLQSAIGFDPSWSGAADLPSQCEIRGEYFGPQSQKPGSANLVVTRHVIEHVPDVMGFLTSIRACIEEGTPVFIETPDVDWTLRNGVFFDFNYEHCSLFNPHSLRLALERSGFDVSDVRGVFDGQYMLAIATAGAANANAVPRGGFSDLRYREARNRYLQSFSELVERRHRSGPVALWGGSSKGVTLCLTLPDADQLIDCVIDLNERKQGCFLPMSGISIVSPTDADARGVRCAIVVNPAYMQEIKAYCDEHQLSFDVLCLEDAEPMATELSS